MEPSEERKLLKTIAELQDGMKLLNLGMERVMQENSSLRQKLSVLNAEFMLGMHRFQTSVFSDDVVKAILARNFRDGFVSQEQLQDFKAVCLIDQEFITKLLAEKEENERLV